METEELVVLDSDIHIVELCSVNEETGGLAPDGNVHDGGYGYAKCSDPTRSCP